MTDASLGPCGAGDSEFPKGRKTSKLQDMSTHPPPRKPNQVPFCPSSPHLCDYSLCVVVIIAQINVYKKLKVRAS